MELKQRVEKGEAVAALLKGLAGMVPVAGPLLAEALGVAIPNLKVARLEKLCEFLAERLFGDTLDARKIEERLHDPAFLDLLEDGFVQAARALSEERLRRIAAFLARGLTDEELDYLTAKRMLTLFGELNDAEVAILVEQARTDGNRRHPYAVLDGEGRLFEELPATERSYRLSVYDSYLDRLNALGLLKAGDLWQLLQHTYGDQRLLVQRPLFYTITPLGWLLLLHVGGAEAGGTPPQGSAASSSECGHSSLHQ